MTEGKGDLLTWQSPDDNCPRDLQVFAGLDDEHIDDRERSGGRVRGLRGRARPLRR